MMTLQEAIAYGKRTGVRWYIRNNHGCIVGGTTTREKAEAMKRSFEIEDRRNPFTRGTTRFVIEAVKD